jgi:hypothetical protein
MNSIQSWILFSILSLSIIVTPTFVNAVEGCTATCPGGTCTLTGAGTCACGSTPPWEGQPLCQYPDLPIEEIKDSKGQVIANTPDQIINFLRTIEQAHKPEPTLQSGK